MAATGKTPILLYGSTTPTNAPAAGNLTNSSDGCEIAINVADKNLFFKDTTNAVNTVPIRQSSASSNGWLSSTDWSTFNSKQPAGSYALTTGTLAQFASTTSAQLAGVISDETGSGSLVFGTSPSMSDPTISGLCNMTGAGRIPVGGSLQFGGTSCSIYIPSADTITFGTSSAEQMRIWPSGGVSVGNFTDPGDTNLSVGGNLVIGTSGKGIDFSATAGTGTSELLADYEEGTWTPTPVNLTVVGSATYSGTYTKVGRSVFWTIYVTPSGASTTASTVSITSFTGLPYSVGTVSTCQAATAVIQQLQNGLAVGTTVYPPTWAAVNAQVFITGTYIV